MKKNNVLYFKNFVFDRLRTLSNCSFVLNILTKLIYRAGLKKGFLHYQLTKKRFKMQAQLWTITYGENLLMITSMLKICH